MSETLPIWNTIEQLLRAPNRDDLVEIRALTRQAIAANRRDDDIGCGDELYALCFLLYLVGDPEDVALVYEAKYLNMDTGSVIDAHLLTMRRDRGTMFAALASLPPGVQRPHLESDLVDAFDRPIFDDSAAFERGLRQYFNV